MGGTLYDPTKKEIVEDATITRYLRPLRMGQIRGEQASQDSSPVRLGGRDGGNEADD
jgi:hypothetical protein